MLVTVQGMVTTGGGHAGQPNVQLPAAVTSVLPLSLRPQRCCVSLPDKCWNHSLHVVSLRFLWDTQVEKSRRWSDLHAHLGFRGECQGARVPVHIWELSAHAWDPMRSPMTERRPGIWALQSCTFKSRRRGEDEEEWLRRSSSWGNRKDGVICHLLTEPSQERQVYKGVKTEAWTPRDQI